MLRITIELLPMGDESRARHLGTAEIWNDGKGTIARGNYGARLSRRGQPNSTWKKASITGFPRKRLGAWDLLYRILREAVGGRNPMMKLDRRRLP